MSLIGVAEEDLAQTLENPDDFGIAFTLYDEDRTEYTGLYCQSTDISFVIEPGTGVGITGRNAECNIRISSLLTKTGGKMINQDFKLKFTNVNSEEFLFIIKMAEPDRKLGLVKCILELLDER